MSWSFGLILACFLASASAQNLLNSTQCGGTKQCVMIPNNCQVGRTCQFMVSYAPYSDGRSAIIELYGKRDGSNTRWVAMGFSTDNQMGNEPVASCVASPNGQAQLVYYFNQGKTPVPLGTVNSADAQLLSSSVTDSYIYCQFLQAINPTTNPSLPRLNYPYQLLLASGPVGANGQIMKHTNRNIGRINAIA